MKDFHYRSVGLGVYTIASQREDPGLILGSACAEFARLCGFFSVVSSHIRRRASQAEWRL